MVGKAESPLASSVAIASPSSSRDAKAILLSDIGGSIFGSSTAFDDGYQFKNLQNELSTCFRTWSAGEIVQGERISVYTSSQGHEVDSRPASYC